MVRWTKEEPSSLVSDEMVRPRVSLWTMLKGETNSDRIFRYIPGVARFWRFLLITWLDIQFLGVRTTRLGRIIQAIAKRDFVKYIKQAPEKYHDILIPDYPIGAKRIIADHGYIPCTKRENFDLIKGSGIQSVSEDGSSIIDPNGRLLKPDIVVLANGWVTTKLTAPMQILGEDGMELKDYWSKNGGIRAYMG